MEAVADPVLSLEHTFEQELHGLFVPWAPAAVPQAELVVLNEGLCGELGLDPGALRSDAGIAVLAGNAVPPGAVPLAQAYAGHQFGGWSPRLGDGRAVLLGELVDPAGLRRDVHLKGAGRTPFARGGDGKAALGPMLREHLIGEAVHALGIPTTRALAVLRTGEAVARDTMLPGAVLVRIAASHLRVGTFQYAAAQGDRDLLQRLADHAITRHHPAAAEAANPPLALFEAVVEAQAALVARWMLVGFIHGVMNTDNMTISGETIDYGPCAFMDAFDRGAVFSSIDHGGRYAYGNQPPVAQWNLARLAETLLPLVDEDPETAAAAATEVLRTFPDRYRAHWRTGFGVKLGLTEARTDDDPLFEDLLALLEAGAVDLTSGFRALSATLRGDAAPARALFADPTGFDPWTERWLARLDLAPAGADAAEVAAAMDRVNPVYVPRNHLVEEALAAATEGAMDPYHRLLEVVTRPFDERPGLDRYALPAPAEFGAGYQTFCGT